MNYTAAQKKAIHDYQQRFIDALNSFDIVGMLQLDKAKNGGYICPVCGSGTGNNGNFTGDLRVTSDHDRVTCFANNCFTEKGEDVLGALKTVSGKSTGEILKDYFADYDINKALAAAKLAPEPHPVAAQKEPEHNEAADKADSAVDFAEYFADCQAKIIEPAAVDYLNSRGIGRSTVEKFGIGFDPAWRSHKALNEGKSVAPSPRLIIPTGAGSYLARAIRPDADERFAKMKEGNMNLFNTEALFEADKEPIFVVEGEIDAMSVYEAGCKAVGIGSTVNTQRLVNLLHDNPIKKTLILCLDNDEAGQAAQQRLSDELLKIGVFHTEKDICPGRKDPNEALAADRDSFIRSVQDAKASTVKPDNIASYLKSDMEKDIDEFKNAAEMSTGFSKLDELMGGIFPGLFILGAVPGLGKTTLMLQIADQIAMSGVDIMFFSLEQSKLELASKSLSRLTATPANVLKGSAMTSVKIRLGQKTTELDEAKKEYLSTVGYHMNAIECNFDCSAVSIRREVNDYVTMTGSHPVVIVDYLQILSPSESQFSSGLRESIDGNVRALKQMSRDLNVAVFAISNLNRSSYTSPVSQDSFKESGGIEYTADVLLGLQLRILGIDKFASEKDAVKKRSMIDEEFLKNPRKLQLTCLKNRYGARGFSGSFDYYPMYDKFVEVIENSKT